MHHVTHISTLCHTYGWVTSHMWRIHVTFMMSHVTHMYESRHTYEWATSHVLTSHVTRMNESHHTYKWVTSRIWMSHITHMNESHHACEWVTAHICMSHITNRNESRHTHVSLVTRTNGSHHTYEWGTSHKRMKYVTLMVRVTNMWHMTREHMWRTLRIYTTCLMHMCDMTLVHVWYASSHTVYMRQYFINMCDRTPSQPSTRSHSLQTSADPLESRCLPIHTYDMSFICVTWLTYMRDMTSSATSYIPFTRGIHKAGT